MRAGQSAQAEAHRQEAIADVLEQAAREARAAAGRYAAAGRTEARTAIQLAPLAATGYHLLNDRRWPGTRRANVDLVLVGPGGVFIVDTKAWASVAIAQGRIYRDQEDVTDSFDNLASLVDLTQSDLAEVGLAPGEVHGVVVLAGKRGVRAEIGSIMVVGDDDVCALITRLGTRLAPTHVDAVLTRALSLFQEMPTLEAPTHAPAIPSADVSQDELFSAETMRAALIEGMEARPIEQWMTFLHPDQARLTRRSFSGPSRIRGGAGTGKTVVGMHRATHLARTRQGRVLVTTFVKTLPAVMRNLVAQFAPDVVDRIEFAGIYGIALDLLAERGCRPNIDLGIIKSCFQEAWEVVGRGGPLERTRSRPDYWRDEIAYVIKGRGIASFADYADLARTGRRTQLQLSQRQAVWELYTEYTQQLRNAEVHDFEDVILLALRELEREPIAGRYVAVIADEAQDLSCAMVRLLYALVGDAVDGLTLIGDGQQSIYPGGYSLGEAGISVSGRATVLDVNYRNTAEIVSFAARVIAGDEVADIEGLVGRGDVAAEVSRHGIEPVVQYVADTNSRYGALIRRVRQVVAQGQVFPGDIGVLCATRSAAQRAGRVLAGAGFPVVPLERYDGRSSNAIKVGTVKRAKGLEFKHVLLPDVSSELLASAQPPADDVARERWDLARRELYVAMTRARDGLWLVLERGGT